MYWYTPDLCREYVSSFDDCIPLETLNYEQLSGVSFSGVNILFTIINMYLSRNVSLCKKIVHLEAKLLLTNVWPFVFFLVGQPARFF